MIVRTVAAPLMLVAARARRRPGRWWLTTLGIALAIAFAGAVLAESTIANGLERFRASSPAASGSGSLSASRSPTGPSCSWPTSRPASSTPPAPRESDRDSPGR